MSTHREYGIRGNKYLKRQEHKRLRKMDKTEKPFFKRWIRPLRGDK